MRTYTDSPWKNRMKTFLLSEDMADVHFLVGTDDVTVRNCMLSNDKACRDLRSDFRHTSSSYRHRRKCFTGS